MDKKASIEKLVNDAYKKGVFEGTWLFAERGETVSKGAVGYRDLDGKNPLQEGSIFYLASVSKQFTASAIMLLRREGLLNLDDKITKIFPGIPYPDVTIRHLLTHTGGLPDYFPWVDRFAKANKIIPRNEIIIRFLCESGEKPLFKPGEKYEYSNTGYCLLAQTVEKVSGVPFEEFMQKNVFEPAGMSDTHVYHRRKDKLNLDNLAYGKYLELSSGKYMLPDRSAESDYAVSVDGMSGGGSVHSNIFDLLKWDKALREGTVLTKEEQMIMYTPGKLNNGETAIDEDGDAYGFGWVTSTDPVDGLIVSHSGSMPGYATWFERFVDKDRVLILLSCRDASDRKAYKSFFNGIRAIAKGMEPDSILTAEEIALTEPDSSEWGSFCGDYEHSKEDSLYIEKIIMKNEELYADVYFKDVNYGSHYLMRLYPLKDRTFCLKYFDGVLTFSKDGLTIWGKTHKKISKEK